MSIHTEILQSSSYDLNAAVTADVDAAIAAATGLRLMGYAIRENAGSAAVATVRIVHGAVAATGDAVIPIELAANGSETKWFGDTGIAFPNGISIEHIAGSVECTLFYKVIPNG